jgi:hypothetical protein
MRTGHEAKENRDWPALPCFAANFFGHRIGAEFGFGELRSSESVSGTLWCFGGPAHRAGPPDLANR